MATHVNTNPTPSLTKDIIIPNIFTWLPKEIIFDIISRLPFETVLILRLVSKSCMSLISSPDLIDTHLLESNNGVFSLLPKVIIYNILLRLRVDTLFRLKFVSKSWLSLISDPAFVKTHLLKSTNDPQFTHYNLLISSCGFFPNSESKRYYDSLDLETLSLYSLLNDPHTETFDYDFRRDEITKVVGSCNGLVCLASWSDVLLWNPCTGEVRELPRLISDQKYRVHSFGFCYDDSNDDFKVFVIFRRDDPNLKPQVSVYSLKIDSWRMINVDFPYPGKLSKLYSRGLFANETIYWAVTPRRKPKVIVSLDIQTEKFGKVLAPKYENNACRWTLGTFGKNLSFCEFGSTCAVFSVLKKCGGVEESWTKLFTIPYMERPTWLTHRTHNRTIDMHMNMKRLTPLSYLKLVNISPDGDIIMMLNSRVQLYNPKDDAYKELFNRGNADDDDDDHNTGYDCEVETYVESLVSPISKLLR